MVIKKRYYISKNIVKVVKRHQLNINIEQTLLKQLKQLALEENLPLSVFIRNSLRKIVSGKEEKYSNKNYLPFSEKDALNYTNFIKALFQKKRVKCLYKNDLAAFNELINTLNTFDAWNENYTKRLKEILLEGSVSLFSAKELNTLSNNRQSACPIYLGLKEWTGCNEYPAQELVCSLGGSLVLLIENQI